MEGARGPRDGVDLDAPLPSEELAGVGLDEVEAGLEVVPRRGSKSTAARDRADGKLRIASRREAERALA